MIKLLKVYLENKFLTLILYFFLTSCAISPGMNPSLISDQDEVYELDFINLTNVNFEKLPSYEDKYKQQTTEMKKLIEDNEYRYLIGKTDVINLNVVDNEEIQGDFTVDGDGLITIPYVGDVKIEGLTKFDAETILETAIAEYYQEPEVIVKILEFNSRYIYITGEINKPQSILLTDKELSIKDAILDSGYLKDQKTFNKTALLRRDDIIYTIDLFQLFDEINLDLDIYLRENDVVHIQKKFEDSIYVFGEGVQGQYPIYSNPNLTKLLANSKMKQETLNADKIFIIREDISKPFAATIYELNAKNPSQMLLANNFNLIPNDIVYLSPSQIVRWNRVISLITPQSGLFNTYTGITEDLRGENFP